jgi:hypothetical protein
VNDVLNPVDIEKSIQECARRIHAGVIATTNAEAKFRDADRALDLAFAHAYMDHKGPAHEKRYAAAIQTDKLRQSRDVTEIAFKFAERQARALEAELRAWQSVGASIRAMYAGERGQGG